MVAMDAGPLLQGREATVLAASRDARQQAQQQRQAEQAAQQQTQEQMLQAKEWDPHSAPLAAAPSATALDRLSGSDKRERLAAAAAAATCSGTTDTDGDGLTDCEEGLLGTEPADPRHRRRSAERCAGGARLHAPGATTQWYSDPLKESTLDDGIFDGQKCAPNTSGQPNCALDANSDGTPDLFDRDIDGDGVPNNLDQSPLPQQRTTFAAGSPMELVVNNYAPGDYIYAEFQLRPTNPESSVVRLQRPRLAAGRPHRPDPARREPNLQYKTFYDVCLQSGRSDCKMSPDANGDIKLVPMLEIEAPAQQCEPCRRSPSCSNFGIFDKTGANGITFIYVPLQLVTDPKTGARVAFYGKMLYKPRVSWGGAHKVRLVWAVQMLVDVCQQSTGATLQFVRRGQRHRQATTRSRSCRPTTTIGR